MVEASPASAFIVIEADFLFQILEVAFDAPAEFRGVDKRGDGRVDGQGREPLSRRLFSPAGHSISSHSSGHGSARQ
jgi:hypothetical protein